MRTTGSWYDVLIDSGEVISCRPAGKLRLKGYRSTNPVAVGDMVDFVLVEDGTGVIEVIRERANCIIRKSVNLSHESHVVASNLDRGFFGRHHVRSAHSTGFMDRFLVTAEAYGIPTEIVLNKIDALSEEERRVVRHLSEIYQDAGYGWLEVSAHTEEGLDGLRAELAKGVHVLSGHSRVGKSTLINKLIAELELKTAEVSESHNKASHHDVCRDARPSRRGVLGGHARHQGIWSGQFGARIPPPCSLKCSEALALL